MEPVQVPRHALPAPGEREQDVEPALRVLAERHRHVPAGDRRDVQLHPRVEILRIDVFAPQFADDLIEEALGIRDRVAVEHAERVVVAEQQRRHEQVLDLSEERGRPVRVLSGHPHERVCVDVGLDDERADPNPVCGRLGDLLERRPGRESVDEPGHRLLSAGEESVVADFVQGRAVDHREPVPVVEVADYGSGPAGAPHPGVDRRDEGSPRVTAARVPAAPVAERNPLVLPVPALERGDDAAHERGHRAELGGVGGYVGMQVRVALHGAQAPDQRRVGAQLPRPPAEPVELRLPRAVVAAVPVPVLPFGQLGAAAVGDREPLGRELGVRDRNGRQVRPFRGSAHDADVGRCVERTMELVPPDAQRQHDGVHRDGHHVIGVRPDDAGRYSGRGPGRDPGRAVMVPYGVELRELRAESDERLVVQPPDVVPEVARTNRGELCGADDVRRRRVPARDRRVADREDERTSVGRRLEVVPGVGEVPVHGVVGSGEQLVERSVEQVPHGDGVADGERPRDGVRFRVRREHEVVRATFGRYPTDDPDVELELRERGQERPRAVLVGREVGDGPAERAGVSAGSGVKAALDAGDDHPADRHRLLEHETGRARRQGPCGGGSGRYRPYRRVRERACYGVVGRAPQDGGVRVVQRREAVLAGVRLCGAGRHEVGDPASVQPPELRRAVARGGPVDPEVGPVLEPGLAEQEGHRVDRGPLEPVVRERARPRRIPANEPDRLEASGPAGLLREEPRDRAFQIHLSPILSRSPLDFLTWNTMSNEPGRPLTGFRERSVSPNSRSGRSAVIRFLILSSHSDWSSESSTSNICSGVGYGGFTPLEEVVSHMTYIRLRFFLRKRCAIIMSFPFRPSPCGEGPMRSLV